MEMKLARTVLCVAIPLVAWWALVRWSAHKLVEHVNEHAKDPRYSLEAEVKDLEFPEFDVDAFRQSLGMPPE